MREEVVNEESRGLMRPRIGIPAGLSWDWKLCQGRLRKRRMSQERHKTLTTVHTHLGSVCRNGSSIQFLFTSQSIHC